MRIFLIICFVFFGTNQSSANAQLLIPIAPQVAAKSHILLDFSSGKVLAEQHADTKLSPASLTKIMTVYVVFRELQNGNLRLDEQVTISKKAWQTPGSRMFVEVNKKVTVENLLQGIIIQSGNDASVALAEHVAGDEFTFSTLMNKHAERLGMTNTHFQNSMGLTSDNHYTTARDLAVLTTAVIAEFPDYYRWDSQKEFTYNNITQLNRNKLLWRDQTVDGVKTGYTKDSGYCLVASALRDGMRLISVVMGAANVNARTNESHKLLNYGFRFFETHKLYQGQQALSKTRIWKGSVKQLPLGLSEDLYVTIPRKHYNDLQAEIKIDKKIMAPVAQGSVLGSVNVSLQGGVIASKPLVALQTVKQGGVVQRLVDAAMMLVE